ncbi:MAG: hypothetical protein NTV70_02155 [Acidobacteria bacterium]|nr:hypothetical protein [Acidobacteriota bacterium]
MTAIEQLDDTDFRRYVLDTLYRELGPKGFFRYAQLFLSERGDYTAERQEWVGQMTLEEVQQRVEALQPRATR